MSAVKQLITELHRHRIRLVLKDGKLKARHPYGPGFSEAPPEVKPWITLMKARKEEIKAYLREQAERNLMDNLYGWTLPCTSEEERRVKAAFESNENIPVPVTPKRSTWLDRWPPLPDLLARLKGAGFRLKPDGELLRVVPPAPPEELPPEALELYNQATARAKAITLHLRGKQHREDVAQNCRVYLLEGPDPMDFRFDVDRQEWVYSPGWWRKEVLH